MSRDLVTAAAEIPAALRDRMLEALGMAAGDTGAIGDDVAPDPSRLAAAALDRLRLVLDSAGDRAVALDLLTADALLTEACAAATVQGPEGMAELTRALVSQLAELLPA